LVKIAGTFISSLQYVAACVLAPARRSVRDELREGAVRDCGAVGSADCLVLEREAAQRLEDDRPLVARELHADPLRGWSHTASRLHCGDLPERHLRLGGGLLETIVLRLRRPPEPVPCR